MWLYRFLFVAAVSLAPTVVFAATLELAPASATLDVGDTISLVVSVSTSEQPANAVAGTLSFPTDLLSVISVSKSSSILSLWVEDPTYSNSSGTVNFSGVVPNPGYQGGDGRIVSVRFKAKAAGTATISFSSSQVLANDGNGTNILKYTNPAIITIHPASPTAVPGEVSVPEKSTPAPGAQLPEVCSTFGISQILIAILCLIIGWAIGRSTKNQRWR